jgi:hypothetical protein
LLPAAALALSLGANAAEKQPPPSDPRDISGVWFGIGNGDPNNGIYRPIEGGPAPLNEAGLAIYNRRHEAELSGAPERQPADECMPHGVPGSIRLPTPLNIIQTPGQVTIVHEAGHTIRIIHMDEKPPAHPRLTFMGYSVGHWDGDTLVVETSGLRANWLDVRGEPTSDRRRITERIRKIEGGKKLEDVFTIDDPEYYTHPWTARREYLWSPGERVEEYVCEENFNRIELPGEKRGTAQ